MRWILGDIHGMSAPLDTMITVVSKRDREARFYFVGDYVNRGPHSSQVLDLLIRLRDRGVARFVRGNHDDVFDLILNGHWLGGEEEAFDPLTACNWFLRHGLLETLGSYGLDEQEVERRRSDDTLLDAIRAAVPPEHKAFLRELPLILDEPDCLVIHAFWPPEESNDSAHVADRLADDAEMAHRVIWERYTPLQILADKPWTRPTFTGHTPVSHYPTTMRAAENVPVYGPKLTLLDTAIALGHTGRLSAVCVEDGTLVQIDRGCRVVQQ